ncbi:hypothetical protein RCL1_007019 [Eukaryota sp. TZLM3-RCL]
MNQMNPCAAFGTPYPIPPQVTVVPDQMVTGFTRVQGPILSQGQPSYQIKSGVVPVQYSPRKCACLTNTLACCCICCCLTFVLLVTIALLVPDDVPPQPEPEPPILYGVISGVVLGPDNLPVENIEVSCPSFETVTTNANGEFSFPEAVYGEYVLTIDHPNYVSENVNVVLDASSVDVEVSLSFSPTRVTITVLHSSTFAPLSAVTTTITCGSASGSGSTSSDGTISFTNVPRGQCSITVNRSGFTSQTRNLLVNWYTHSETIHLVPSTTPPPPPPPPATVSVTITVVRDSNGAVLSGVQLVVTGNGYSETRTTDSNGRATFPNLVVNQNYQARAQRTGFQTLITDFPVINGITQLTMRLKT